MHDSLRSQSREPIHNAATLDQSAELAAPEAQPSDQAVRQDETAIMWRALEAIPEIYREPLVLFHRENQSIERVAESLELSEDTVRQRLVRGRQMLRSEVEKVVEGALQRTAPGPAFTSGVMGALPATIATKAAAGGVAAAKGAAGGGAFGILTAIMTSPIAPIAIVWLGAKLRLTAEGRSPTAEERELRQRSRREFVVGMLAMFAFLQAWGTWYRQFAHPPWYAPLGGLVAYFVFPILWIRQQRTRRRIWDVWAKTGTAPARMRFEHRSRRELLGWPLIHVRIGSDPVAAVNRKPVRAWVAVGDVAHGAVFACGRLAIAPVSIGIFGIGLIGLGVMSAGGFAAGFEAAGALALGFFSLGWMAKGVGAFGIRAAYGVQAYAGKFAGCSPSYKKAAAYAPHANDQVAADFFTHSRFFSWTSIGRHEFEHWLKGVMCALLAFGLLEICWNFWRLRRSGR